MPENDTLKVTRHKLLEALDDAKYSAEDLDAVWKAALAKMPELFESHKDLDDYAVEEDSSKWYQDNYVYYVKQKEAAERNFSELRWQHLLDIRSLFREGRYRGFAPQSPGNPAASTDTETVSHSSSSIGESVSHPSPRRNQDMYQVSDNLKRSVDKGNLTAVRVALQQEMGKMQLNQRDLQTAASWVKDRQPGVFAPFEEHQFTHAINPQQNVWNVDYHDKQMISLENNFSEKRFQHVLEVREYLRNQSNPDPRFTPPKEAPKTSPSPPRALPHTPPPSHTSGDDGMSPMLKKILAIGGALAALLVLLLLGK